MPGSEKPQPIALVKQGTDKVIAYACGKCGQVVGSVKDSGDVNAHERAVEHCGPWTCKTCGKEHDRPHQYLCHQCFTEASWKRDAAREMERLLVANKVHEWDGPVYCEALSNWNEGFFENPAMLIEVCNDEGRDVPAYVWTCTSVSPSVDFDSCREQALDDHWEGAYLVDEMELHAFLEQWNQKQTSETWYPNYKRALVLSQADTLFMVLNKVGA